MSAKAMLRPDVQLTLYEYSLQYALKGSLGKLGFQEVIIIRYLSHR